jgi:hypothetical protein
MNHHETMINLLKTHFGDKEITGIEIGTGGGGLPAGIMLLCKNVKHLFTIDPYKHKDNIEFESGWPQDKLDATREIAIKRLAEYGEKITMLHMESNVAFEKIKDMVDFVWIDGDHTELQVIDDLRFEKFVKPGGFIGGHDFGQVPLLTNVIKAIYGDRINTGMDFTWWVFIN